MSAVLFYEGAAAQLFSLRLLLDIYFKKLLSHVRGAEAAIGACICHFASSAVKIRVQIGKPSNGSDACHGASRDVEESRRREISVARRPYADPLSHLDGLWCLGP